MGEQHMEDDLKGTTYEHEVYENILECLDSTRKKRVSYMKYGPIFIMASAAVFLLLMFVTELKTEFLVLWIASVLYCIALMIRAEYKYYRICRILMIPAEDEE